ncbi:hypothetical protein B1H10_03850 [candidate division KSB1 bacterium 4484_188]|nr:MAG: hypothetical protein B1H10_03850 [candidate division KSB1 bacterium 4484_188]
MKKLFFIGKRKNENNRDLPRLVERAQKVLQGNWLGHSTKPSPHLYPHQWNWDSGFIAIGYARYHQKRAQQELSTLFQAQWINGMLPQIVFNREALDGYSPEPDFWQCEPSAQFPGVFTDIRDHHAAVAGNGGAPGLRICHRQRANTIRCRRAWFTSDILGNQVWTILQPGIYPSKQLP